MASNNAVRPPRDPIAWAIAGAIVAAGLVLGGLWWRSTPPPVPIAVLDTRDEYVIRDGTEYWRVEMDVEAKVACQTVVIGRSFAPEEGGPIWHQVPARSYLDVRGRTPGSLRYSINVSVGRLDVWHEYAIRDGEAGALIVEVEAHGCDNNFSGRVGEWRVPFDWRR